MTNITQSNHQQQVNQTAGHVEAETQKPQNQKHNENCPQHIDLLSSIEGLRNSSSLSSRLERAISRTPGKTSWSAR